MRFIAFFIRNPRLVLLAGGAKPVHLQLVALDPIMVFSGQQFFQAIQARFLELQNLPAAQAPEVAVLGVAVDGLVVPVAIGKVHLPDQAAIDEQGDGPVDGGPGDLDPPMAESEVEFVHIEVGPNLENFLEDPLSLRCAPQSPLADVFLENLDLWFHLAFSLLRLNKNNTRSDRGVKE
jgi:hypothetical protein